MKKKTKVTLIVTFSLVGVLALGYAAGVITGLVLTNDIFNGRLSDENSLNDYECRIRKIRKDYSLLAERETITFQSNGNNLKGYLYTVSSPKGLVISAHGIQSLSDDYNAEYQQWFVSQGYDLLAVDLTSSGHSEGNGIDGLHRSAYDVKAAYDAIKDRETYSNLPLILTGHAWGAYGAAASMSLGVPADYLISFSGFSDPKEMMFAYSKQYVSFLAYLSKWTYDLWLDRNIGEAASLSGIAGINQSSAKIFLVQGKKDDFIQYNSRISLYGSRDSIKNHKLETFLVSGATNLCPWLSDEARNYIDNEITPKYNELSTQYSKNIPSDKLEEFYSSVDLDKSSELNPRLFETIGDFLGI